MRARHPIPLSLCAAAALFAAAGPLPARATEGWESRKLMNLRANMHNAFMQDYPRESGGLKPAPGWLRTTGAKLATKAQMGLNRSWRFYIAGSDVPNLVATPYGTVIVHQGMLDLGLSQDELTALVAHELAHVAQDHAVKLLVARMQKEQLGPYTDEEHGEKSGQLSRLREIVLDLRYAPVQEKEADELALGLLEKAGLDPAALPSALKALAKSAGGSAQARKAAYFRTHPGLLLRIGLCQKLLKAVREGGATLKVPAAEGRPEIGRPAYMRRAMDEGYDLKKPLKKGGRR